MADVCRAILGNNGPNALIPGLGLPDRERFRLERFLNNVRFKTTHGEANGEASTRPKILNRISNVAAANYRFIPPNGTGTNIAQYFESVGTPLQHPNYVCIEVLYSTIYFWRQGAECNPKTSTGVPFPIELCRIIPGQLMRKQLPHQLTSSVLSFSTKVPDQRLNSIVAGHSVLQYGQSGYMHEFGMTVSQTPESCLARVLPTPALNYGAGSKRKQIKPANGSWNLADQKFFKPAEVTGWAVVVYDTDTVRELDVRDIIRKFKGRADLLGIRGLDPTPPISYPPPQPLDVHQHLNAAATAVFNTTKKLPSLIVIIMPNNSADLYKAVKHFGDVKRGIPTQCLNAAKAKKGNPQYFANVWLKANAKLGGINSILDPQAQKFLSDPANPAMVIGASVTHPAPGASDRPSFASVVGSIDSTASIEIIMGLEDLVYELIGQHMYWKKEQEKEQNVAPKRIIYYRDGFSEGQFQVVLEFELRGIKGIRLFKLFFMAACARHKINPLITLIVVGKRHHIRFFPTHGQADMSGNCPAGTVVDDVQPTEFDFYLQSHGGLHGTSRPKHYSPDNLQALSFALCHVCARSTRSVSIPAPIHYAHIMCVRAKIHYDPSIDLSADDGATATSGEESWGMQRFRDQLQPIHESMRYKMLYVASALSWLTNNAHTGKSSSFL
ncbi:hypothetical protein FRC10_010683 [Ceratobasidium sp. 414]|nr:hypothetical protein FRC10_010683 [Ceratobasidium sp. 414]